MRAYMRSIPEDERVRHRPMVLDHAFPLFALEDAAGWRFFGEGEIAEAVTAYRNAQHAPDEDGCYAILFRFTTSYCPTVPGADEMGALWHVHITREGSADGDYDLAALLA